MTIKERKREKFSVHLIKYRPTLMCNIQTVYIKIHQFNAKMQPVTVKATEKSIPLCINVNSSIMMWSCLMRTDWI